MDELKTWIEPHHPTLSIRQQCRILNLNRSNIYYTPRETVYTDEQLSGAINSEINFFAREK